MDETAALASTPLMRRRDRYGALLTDWCRALRELQVDKTTAGIGGLSGGILCPACARIHGRSADAVYPLLYQARVLQSEAYRDAAVRLLDWSDCVTTTDGAFLNEPTGHSWKGITVFSLLALGEALRHHGDLLEDADQARWRDRLQRGADFLMGYDIWQANINYPVSAAAALAVCAVVLEDARYREQARETLHRCLPYFQTENALLFGEGQPKDGFSPRGCRAIDLGYNVEESLPGLALCAHLLGDEAATAVAVRSLQSHLEFLLPDGAWDNSWGSRSYKWTYWGSRTSDGCQSALALLAAYDDRFLLAADRNLSLLESCTQNGLLYGGPHLFQRGDLPCVHHTFCHAKALAAALDTPALQNEPTAAAVAVPASSRPAAVALPREAGTEPIRRFPEIATHLIAWSSWRATVTNYDWKYQSPGEHPSGGALSLLWHAALGPVFAASMTRYRELEPGNMQPWRLPDPPQCLTPHLLLEQDGQAYRSLLATDAQVSCTRDADAVTVTVRGHLGVEQVDQRHLSLRQDVSRAVGRRLRSLKSAAAFRQTAFLLRYRFEGEAFAMTAQVGAGATLILPLIATRSETITQNGERELTVEKPGGVLHVEAGIPLPQGDSAERIFNPVPGFEAYPLRVLLPAGREVTIRLEVRGANRPSPVNANESPPPA
ncbi:MAG: hypothetical protein H7Z41_15150 [Cytophagales bacterium]|nr:hypothetical protein [Armatimonadota bacterium]